MTATHTPPSSDPSRSGAVWVTGMGAFLLLAAAAVFTAVRWDQIPDAAKLGALVAATGSCLIAGRGLRATLPASAGALVHLGAFLVPIDVAAVGVRAQLDWSSMLLVQGLVATVTFAWAAAAERSVVLRWATAGSLVVLAGGIGATTPIPAPIVLAAIAVGALALQRTSLAIGVASLTGLVPLLHLLDEELVTGRGVLTRIGLVGDDPRLLSVVSGIACAAVLAVVGRRQQEAGLAVIGIGVGALGTATSIAQLDPSGGTTLIAAATAFLVAELAALATRRDPFWSRAVRPAAAVAELAAGVAVAVGVIAAAVAIVFDAGEIDGALSLSVLALGWIVAGLRTDQRRHRAIATVGAGIASAATVAVGTGSPGLTSMACTLVGVAALVTPDRARAHELATTVPGGPALVALMAVTAPWVAVLTGPWAVAACGAAGAALLTEAAVRHSRTADPTEPAAAGRIESWAWMLALTAAVPAFTGAAGVAEATGAPQLGLIAGTLLAGALAVQADRGRTGSSMVPLGTVARIQPLFLLAAGAALPPARLGAVAVVVAVVSAFDAARLRRPELALVTSVALPTAVGTLVHAAGLPLPSVGVALTVTAAVLAGLGWQLGRTWALPFVVGIGLSLGAGIVLAAGEPSSFADAVMVSGGIGLAAAVATARLDGVFLSGAVVTSGIWMRLAVGDVGASEPYLLPVCVLLCIAGARARSIGASSWIAYGPAVGLLGGSALLERTAGGPAWHALTAGSVGVAAVAFGGSRRLAAPLLLGTAVLVALVGYETLAITAGLPTWVWLALGGGLLLGAGVAMERRDVGPLETGRRLVDVVTDRFE